MGSHLLTISCSSPTYHLRRSARGRTLPQSLITCTYPARWQVAAWEEEADESGGRQGELQRCCPHLHLHEETLSQSATGDFEEIIFQNSNRVKTSSLETWIRARWEKSSEGADVQKGATLPIPPHELKDEANILKNIKF